MTSFEQNFVGQVARFSDGTLVTSATCTKDEALSLFRQEKPNAEMDHIESAWVRFYGVYDDGEFKQMWWLEWEPKRGAKPVWVLVREEVE